MDIIDISEKNEDSKIHFLCFTLFTLFLLYFHYKMVINYGDDIAFMQKVRESDFKMLTHLINSYNNWSSRLLYYIFSMSFLKSEIGIAIWKIVNIFLILLSTECILRITLSSDKIRYSYFFYLIFLLIPVQMLNDCGWLVCCVFYLWPIATIMPTFLVIKHIITDSPVSSKLKVFSILLSIYALESEQICVLIFVFDLIMIFYQKMITKKRVDVYFYILLGISLMQLIILITCPGNMHRMILEENTWWPGFSEIPLLNKFVQGFISTMSFYFGLNEAWFRGVSSYPNFVILLTILLMIINFCMNKKKRNILLLLPSLVILCFFGYLPIILKQNGMPLYSVLYLFKNNTLPIFSYFSKGAIIVEFIVFGVVLITICLAIYTSFSNRMKGVFVTLVFIAGLCTRLMLSISPTIFGSGFRTFLVMTISIIFVNLFLFNEILKLNIISNKTLLIVILFYSFFIYYMPKDNYRPSFPEKETELPGYDYSSEQFSYYIDNKKLENSILSLEGWAFFENDDCDIYIGVNNKIYKSKFEQRTDVKDLFKLNNDNLGFIINIYLYEKNIENFTLYLVNNTKNTIYSTIIPVKD